MAISVPRRPAQLLQLDHVLLLHTNALCRGFIATHRTDGIHDFIWDFAVRAVLLLELCFEKCWH